MLSLFADVAVSFCMIQHLYDNGMWDIIETTLFFERKNLSSKEACMTLKSALVKEISFHQGWQ